MLYLSSPWITHSITGSLYLPLPTLLHPFCSFPHPVRLANTSLFPVFESLLVSVFFVVVVYSGLEVFLESTCKWNHMVFVSVWLISLSLIPLGPSMLLQMVKSHSFLWLNNIPLYIYTIVYLYHIFFIHSTIDGLLGCFHTLANVNNAAVNIEVHVSFQISVFVFFG